MKMPNLCTPSMLYLVISAIAVIIAIFNRFTMSAVLVKVLFIGLWTWFLNFLCKKGYKGISWFLVLFPYILIAITMFLTYGSSRQVVRNNNKK